MDASECRRAGRLEATGLHLDHDPPLTGAERTDWRNVCDELRVGLLCAHCHSRKTLQEQRDGRV